MTPTTMFTLEDARGILHTTELPTEVTSLEDVARVATYTGDLDPVYFAIYRARTVMGEDWTRRFAVGVLCYYHMGVAAQMADHEGDDFWEYAKSIYPTSPRGTMRRHWRGGQGEVSMASMIRFAPDPAVFFDQFEDCTTYPAVRNMVKRHLVGFGDYFILKIADFLDRCFDTSIDAVGLENHLSKFPAQAAVMVYPTTPTVADSFLQCYERIRPLQLPAPPLFDRRFGLAELETLLCMYKRIKTGGYIIGTDTRDKFTALKEHGPSAEKLAALFPPAFDLSTFKCNLS